MVYYRFFKSVVSGLALIVVEHKDKISQDLPTRIFYKISCKDYEKVYIGETSRASRSRAKSTKELFLLVLRGPRWRMQHLQFIRNNHNFDFDNVNFRDCCPMV